MIVVKLRKIEQNMLQEMRWQYLSIHKIREQSSAYKTSQAPSMAISCHLSCILERRVRHLKVSYWYRDAVMSSIGNYENKVAQERHIKSASRRKPREREKIDLFCFDWSGACSLRYGAIMAAYKCF